MPSASSMKRKRHATAVRVGAEGGIAQHPLAVGPPGEHELVPLGERLDRRLGAHPVVVRVRVRPLLRRHEHRRLVGATSRSSPSPQACADANPGPTSGPVKCATTLPAVTTIPEKPSLEGLEAKWRARWEADGTYRFDRTKARAEVFSIDTPPPTVSGSLHSGTCVATPTPTSSPATSACAARRSSTRWGGTTTASTSSGGSSSLTGTIVDPTLPYDPDFRRPEKVDPKARAIAVSRPNFIELCEEVVPEFEAAYHDLWATVGLSVDWDHTYTTIGTEGDAHVPAGVPAPRAARPGLPQRVAHAVGRRHAHVGRPGRARRTASCRGRTTSSCSPAPTARCLSTPPGRSCCPPAWPSSPTPTTSATSRSSASGPPRRCSASSVPDRRPRAGRPREGHRRRDDLHLRRHHRRHVVARAVAAGPRHRAARRPPAPDHLGRAGLGVDRPRRGADRLRRAGRQDGEAGTGPHRRAAHRGGPAIEGEIRPITHAGEVLGERHPPPRDRHQPAVVHPLPAQGRDARPRQGAGVVARLHAGPVRELGQRAHRRLEHHPPAVLRRAVPGLVPDRRRRRHRLPVADPRRRGGAAGRPHRPPCRPATTSRSATSPAGSRPTPT